MPRTLRAPFAIALVGAAASLADAQAAPFEGVITYQMEHGVTMLMSLGGGHVRIEVSGRLGMDAIILGDTASSIITMLVPQMHRYMKTDFASDIARLSADTAGAPQFIVTNTMRSDTVAGMPCEVWHVDGSIYSYDVCGARNLGPSILDRVPNRGSAPPAVGPGFPKPFFPLRQNGKYGPPVMLATKIERKKLDPKIFEIPEGYTGVDMSGLRFDSTGPRSATPITLERPPRPIPPPTPAPPPPPRAEARPIPPPR